VGHVRRTHGCASPVVLESRPDGSQAIRHAGGDIDWRAGGTRLRAHGKPHRPSDVVETCQWLPGNVLAFETDLFLRLDGFDPRRFPQNRGDADFTLRATNLGRPCDVLHSSWVVNDRARTGMHFDSRVSPRLFVRGLVSLKSNYHLASTLRFYVRHCPWQYVPWSIAVFYLKYLYATIKTWR
jgi:GT2 family glycosyltransferase